jgi:hypothetical protein
MAAVLLTRSDGHDGRPKPRANVMVSESSRHAERDSALFTRCKRTRLHSPRAPFPQRVQSRETDVTIRSERLTRTYPSNGVRREWEPFLRPFGCFTRWFDSEWRGVRLGSRSCLYRSSSEYNR